VVPTVRYAEESGNPSDVDVNQQLLSELARGDGLANVPFSEARTVGSVGKESTSPRFAPLVMIVVVGLGSLSCLVRFLCSSLFISDIHYYTRPKVVELLRVYFIYGFFIAVTLFRVLWDIARAAFQQLMALKEPPGDGVEAQ